MTTRYFLLAVPVPLLLLAAETAAAPAKAWQPCGVSQPAIQCVQGASCVQYSSTTLRCVPDMTSRHQGCSCPGTAGSTLKTDLDCPAGTACTRMGSSSWACMPPSVKHFPASYGQRLLSSIQAAAHAINKRRLLQEQTPLNKIRHAVLLTPAQTTSAMQQDAEAAPVAPKGSAVPAAAKASSNSTTNGTTKAIAAATPAAANNASQTAPAPGA